MGQGPTEAERTMATKFVCFFKWKTVARGSGREESCMDPFGKKGYGCSGNYLAYCVLMKMDIVVLERLMEPENEEISPRYILKYSTREGSNISQLFDTAEKKDHFVASRGRLERTKPCKNVGKISGKTSIIKE